VKNIQVYVCPSSQRLHAPGGGWPSGTGTSYGYNYCRIRYDCGYAADLVQYPAEMAFLFDWPYSCIKYRAHNCSDCPIRHSWWDGTRVPPHNDGLNVCFLDGHTKWLSGDKVYQSFLSCDRLFDGY